MWSSLSLNKRAGKASNGNSLPYVVVDRFHAFDCQRLLLSTFLRTQDEVPLLAWEAQRPGGASGTGSPSRSHFFRYWMMRQTFLYEPG